MRIHLPLLAIMLVLAGCGGGERAWQPQADLPERRAIEGSIFPSDLAVVGNDAVNQVLDGKVPLREHGGLAVLAIGRCHLLDAGFAERVRAGIAASLAGNRYVGEVVTVPRMLMPNQVTVSALREMGARLQCENVLVYTVSDDARYDYNLFTKDQLRVALTVEAVVVNVRTGCMPIASSIDRETVVEEVAADHDRYEFARRAQRTCVSDALAAVCARIDALLSAKG